MSATIKNRAPAAIQITAEQLLREAYDRGIESVAKAPKQFITDKDELVFYQQGKRKDFEDQLQRQRGNAGLWCKYGLWEASQLEFERARSVFERALDVDYRNQTIWLKYAEMEMKNKFINHARNVWDRAVTLLPRVDSFWYKYSYMEEMVGAIDNARQIFERWMSWEPDDLAWGAYIKFELRQKDLSKARQLFERYIKQLPTCRAYLKYARWEEEQREHALARRIYERALTELHHQEKTEKLIVNFARFEERCKEYDRARIIYQYAIEMEGEEKSQLKAEYLSFEKRNGKQKGIEDQLFARKKDTYEKQLESDPNNYDVWIEYIRLMEVEDDHHETLRSIYERAIKRIPVVREKKFWKRYIYLWINYAVFEELTVKNLDNTRRVYHRCLEIIPHKLFTFGKIWLQAAMFEIRCKNVNFARKLFGQAIGMCGKRNIYKGYIELELQLGEIERCRLIYSKYITSMPHSCEAWQSFAKLEISLGETARARSIFDLAINQPELDMPEILWKSYIDFEMAENELNRVRALYEKLLQRSTHVKIWIAYARTEFERCKLSEIKGESDPLQPARLVFSRGYDCLRKEGLKQERVLLLESWRDVETEALRLRLFGAGEEHVQAVEAKFPKKLQVKGIHDTESIGNYDLLFPDDEQKLVGMKLLEKAFLWKNAVSEGVESSSMVKETSSRKRNFAEIHETIDLDL